MDPKARLYSALAVRWPTGEHAERALAELDECGVTAVDEDAGATRFFFANAEARDRAAAILASIDPTAEISAIEVSDDNWAERSQASIAAVRVGRLTVAPPWDVPSDGTTVIVIEPSMGFGTGHHESTRLCLRLLQEIDIAGRSVLDAGTGSGVLAIAARTLGAATVVGADYDPDAIQNARDNVALNGLGPKDLPLLVLDLAEPAALGPQRFDLVFANLTGGVLQRFASELAGRLVPGGSLIVSGVMATEEADVARALSDAGLTMASRLAEREWIGARFVARP